MVNMEASLDINQVFSVKGLVAVITGGGTGIGLMMAQAIEANGGIVYILGRRKEVLEKAASTAKHGNICPIQADVTSKKDLQAAVDEIQSEQGFVNVVVANSGIGGPTIQEMPSNPSISQVREFLWKWDSDEFTNTFTVNCVSVFNTVVAFLELLDQGNKRNNVPQRSQVIATSSIGGFNRIPAQGYPYSASKAAVTHMFKQLSTTLVPFNIRANILAPGLYPSELADDAYKTWEKQGFPKTMFPEGRAGEVTDMAGAILFLVSRAGGYINGNVIVTDGGRLSIVPSTY